MTKITIDRATVEQALEALIKNARLLGSTQAGKLFGSYSQEDAKFERMFNESIAKHKASIIAALEQLEHEPVGEVLNERGEVDYISYVPPVGTRLYTAPLAAQPAPVQLTDDELDVCRQWFNSVQDTNGGYLTGHDYVLAEKLYLHLGLRVPDSVKQAAHGIKEGT